LHPHYNQQDIWNLLRHDLAHKEKGASIPRKRDVIASLRGKVLNMRGAVPKTTTDGRRLPLKERKKIKENFRQSLSRQVITTERVRSFFQRARAYIVAYHMIRQDQELTTFDSSASVVVNEEHFGHCCLSCERGEAAEVVQDT
jgi:hypothetical protein